MLKSLLSLRFLSSSRAPVFCITSVYFPVLSLSHSRRPCDWLTQRWQVGNSEVCLSTELSFHLLSLTLVFFPFGLSLIPLPPSCLSSPYLLLCFFSHQASSHPPPARWGLYSFITLFSHNRQVYGTIHYWRIRLTQLLILKLFALILQTLDKAWLCSRVTGYYFVESRGVLHYIFYWMCTSVLSWISYPLTPSFLVRFSRETKGLD